jgi:hypothetical protein
MHHFLLVSSNSFCERVRQIEKKQVFFLVLLLKNGKNHPFSKNCAFHKQRIYATIIVTHLPATIKVYINHRFLLTCMGI